MSDTRQVDVVLHVGSDKTGTTSLQQLFRRNRGELADRGILYPRAPGRVRHVGLGLYARPDHALPETRDWVREDYPAPDVFRRRLRRRLLRETASSGASQLLLSDEALFRMATDSFRRLHGLLTPFGGKLRVVAYLRRQDNHLMSRYQQAVKVGEVHPMAVWAQRDFRTSYDYAERIAVWQEALRPDDIMVRPFERSRFAEGSLAQDFLRTAGLDLSADDLHPVEVRNESLGVEAVEMLRILNIDRVENQGLQTWEISNREHVRRLRGVDAGPQLTLPPSDLDHFLRKWEESNRRVAVDHLHDPSGELFRDPRKTDGTTTEQILAPDRVDHYLHLLEIPEHRHDAVRRVAEREAARA